MSLIRSLASVLDGTPSGNGFMCKCPAHADSTRSLSITEGTKEPVVFKCFAGCEFKAIITAVEAMGVKLPKEGPKPRTKKKHLTYDYHDESGNYVFTKHKMPKGSKYPYFITRGEEKGLGGITPPLYHLHELHTAADGSTVLVAEGEKDVESLRELGYIATCNYDGASKSDQKPKWKNFYNKEFDKHHVVIFCDHDDPGLAHGLNIAKNLCGKALSVKLITGEALGVGPKEDISDLLGRVSSLEERKKIVSTLIESAEPYTLSSTAKEALAGTDFQELRTAHYDDYVKLFRTVLGELKRDLFSGDLMYKSDMYWEAAKNYEDVLKSAAIQHRITGVKYKAAEVKPHLAYLEHKTVAKLIFEIPEWDGRKRIREFAAALKPSKKQGFTPGHMEYFLTDWLVGALRRVHNPYSQNRILILHGDQGIGKDRFTDSLLCGAGQWYKPLSVVQGDKDTFLQLSRSMFLKIAEFDKTSKMEVSLLKDLITTPSTDIRASYDRTSLPRPSRASFISGCNVDDILRDHTGFRRYIVLELSDLPVEFPIMDEAYSLQTFAEARHLANSYWAVNAEYEKDLKLDLGMKSPEDPIYEILSTFASCCANWAKSCPEHEFRDYTNHARVVGEVAVNCVLEAAKILHVKPRQVQTALRSQRLGVRTSKLRGYKVPGMVGKLAEDNPSHILI